MKLLDERDELNELDELLAKMQREEKVKEKAKAQQAGQQTSVLALPPALPPISKEKTPYRVVRLLVRHALTKRGKGKRIGQIAEQCGLTIGQAQRHLRALIKGRMARQVGRGNGTRYFYREYGPLVSTNPAQIKPGQKGPQPLPPMTGEGSGRGRRTQPLTDEERKKSMALADEIMAAFERQDRNRR